MARLPVTDDRPTDRLTGRPDEDGRRLVTGRHDGGRLVVPPERLRVRDAELHGVDLTGAGDVAGRLSIVSSVLVECDLSGLDLGNATLSDAEGERRTVYRRCRFRRTTMTRARLFRARFEECVFEDVDWRSVQLHAVDLVGNRFAGEVRELTLWGAPPGQPVRNEVRDNDLSGARLLGLGTRGGVDVAAQRWPSDAVVVRDAPEVAAAVLDREPDLDAPTRRRLERFAADTAQRDQLVVPTDPTLTPGARRAVELLVTG